MSIKFFKAQAVALCLLAAGSIILTLPARGQGTNAPHTLADLRTALDAHINQPRFHGALWGVKIVTADTGRVIYESHPDRLMSPASNSKLYTGALALDTFGSDYQFSTPILATAKVDATGTLPGDLIISGRGDPSWKATNFDDIFTPFIAAITNAGVQRVTGDLVMDTTFFHGPSFGSSWCIEDITDSEGAETSAITVQDNVAPLRVTPGKKLSDPGTLEFLLPHTGLTLVNRTQTSKHDGTAHLDMWRAPGSKTLFILGEIPLGAEPEILDVPVPEPAVWFGEALKAALTDHGVTIAGRVRCVAWPEVPPWNKSGLITLGEIKSSPLRDLIHAFMKPSQNLETDLIFDHTGETLRATNVPPWQTSEESAVIALHQFLATNSLPDDLHFDEGSGLSRNNLTSANTTVGLLRFMSTRPYAQDYYDALPIAGVDGTIRRRMKGTPAAQNVHAKTGTLRWVNALSGHVTTAAGEKLIFSLMLNRYDSPPNRPRTAELDDIAVLLAGFTGHTDE